MTYYNVGVNTGGHGVELRVLSVTDFTCWMNILRRKCLATCVMTKDHYIMDVEIARVTIAS